LRTKRSRRLGLPPERASFDAGKKAASYLLDPTRIAQPRKWLTMRQSLLIAVAVLFLLAPGSAVAQGYDARGMAMGGVSLDQGSGSLARINPAYRAVPPRVSKKTTSIPVPIGVIQFLKYFPELDPDSEDFSAIGIVNFITNVPWAWEFKQPHDPDQGLEIWLGQDQLVFDLKDAREVIPRDGFTMGSMGSPADLGLNFGLGDGAGLLHLSLMRPFIQTQVDFNLDEELVKVLADAEPVTPSTDYTASASALMQAGFSSGLAWAVPLSEEGNGGTDGEGGGLWFGAGYRHYFGGGYVRLDGDLGLHSGDPIFSTSDTDTFDASFQADYQRAWPNSVSSVGYGNAIDLGAVWRSGRLEIGAGVADIFADLTWKNTQLDHSYLDPDFNEVITENVAQHFVSCTEIPVSWMTNASWLGDRYLLAASVVEQPGGLSVHGGGEFWLNRWLAVRGGFLRDQRSRMQGSWGAGFRLGPWGIDAGFQTHNLGLTQNRGVSMGLAVTLY